MANMWDKGELGIGEDFIHESILGTVFTGRIVEETEVAGIPAIVPEITGQAWITQYSQIVCDPSDPFQEGYTVGDIWAS
jgi:proline racemase